MDVSNNTKSTCVHLLSRAHLASPLHQVNHAVELVHGAEASRGAVEAKRPPGGAVSVLAPQVDDLDHGGRRVLRAHRRPLPLIAQARHICAPLLAAPQAFEHVYRVRRVRLAPPGVVHGCNAYLPHSPRAFPNELKRRDFGRCFFCLSRV
ncbi:unnamed protein product [Ectocarpus sp. 13 AM-2016]